MSSVIGLTGGIGSGKTTTAALFAARGAGIVDTDAISHQLTQPGGRAMASIRQAFPKVSSPVTEGWIAERCAS